MSKLRVHISVSLDNNVAGPNQSNDNPLGEGGQQLHRWAFALTEWLELHDMLGIPGFGPGESNESSPVVVESRANLGAGIMGRGMFGPPAGGPWGAGSWTGWWDENPPYHYPVFVLTHHEREPLVMEGGTTFYFVTDGIESALRQAKEAAGDKDVMLWGGAETVNEYLAAGLVDVLELHVVPILLGDGAKLFESVAPGSIQLEQVRVVAAPGVTHLKFDVTPA